MGANPSSKKKNTVIFLELFVGIDPKRTGDLRPSVNVRRGTTQ
jgi:hypothetical protein